MIRVAIYDDHEPRRESLAAMMRLMPEYVLAGTYPDCRNVMEEIQAASPDVVLMDLEMPEYNGIFGIGCIKKHFPRVKVLVQTAFDDDERVFAAFRAGADGYILKSASVAKITQSIDDVMNGGASMSPSIAAKVLRYFEENINPQKPSPGIKTRDYDLSAKELEVLKRLKKGMTYKMIADELGISYFTVNNHIKKIYEKLQVHSVGEAIGIAFREKLV